MTLEEMTERASPYLLCWIELSIAPKKLTDISQLRKIKRLADKDFPVPHSDYTAQKLAPIQDFLHSRTGGWEMLGEMTGLQVLEFPPRTPPGLVEDFSFLPKLKNLYRLHLQATGFTDCSLLSGLTQLKNLYLPARKKLIHTEALDALSCKITFDDPFYQDDTFPDHHIVPAREAPAPVSQGIAVRYLEYGKNRFEGEEITDGVLEKLSGLIRAGKTDSAFLSLDENGEEDFFTIDIADGWAAPVFSTWDEKGDAVCFQPVNEKFDSVEEDAPVEIGGQSPVPKRFALDDLALAAECAVWFARTGELCPRVPWAEFR